MTKYQYESGKTYLSESTPISVRRLPRGDYRITAVKDNMTASNVLTSKAGTQSLTLVLTEV